MQKKTIGVINCECLIYMQGRCRGGGGEVIAPPFPTILKQYRSLAMGCNQHSTYLVTMQQILGPKLEVDQSE
jgi:hypothetical protein